MRLDIDPALIALVPQEVKDAAQRYGNARGCATGSIIPYDQLLTLIGALVQERNEARKGHERYEKVRLLNPHQFTDLFRRNMDGEGHFDALVDQLESRR